MSGLVSRSSAARSIPLTSGMTRSTRTASKLPSAIRSTASSGLATALPSKPTSDSMSTSELEKEALVVDYQDSWTCLLVVHGCGLSVALMLVERLTALSTDRAARRHGGDRHARGILPMVGKQTRDSSAAIGHATAEAAEQSAFGEGRRWHGPGRSVGSGGVEDWNKSSRATARHWDRRGVTEIAFLLVITLVSVVFAVTL